MLEEGTEAFIIYPCERLDMKNMDIQQLIAICDHTLLSPTATVGDIRALIDDGIKYSAASVCIPSYYVKDAAEYAARRIKICTQYSPSEILPK